MKGFIYLYNIIYIIFNITHGTGCFFQHFSPKGLLGSVLQDLSPVQKVNLGKIQIQDKIN